MADAPTAVEIETNRLDLLSRLAGDLSHEIKNPLHAMVINLELVRRRVQQGQGENALERVAVVEHEIKRVHELVHALLEALRPPRSSAPTADAARILSELMPLLTARARLARVDFTTQLPLETIVVTLSPQFLRQVILNLVDRAVRRAGTGGSVAMNGAAREGLELTIIDRAAVDSEDAEDGTGSDDGIRIVQALARRAGGELRVLEAVDSSPGEVTLRLPRAATA